MKVQAKIFSIDRHALEDPMREINSFLASVEFVSATQTHLEVGPHCILIITIYYKIPE